MRPLRRLPLVVAAAAGLLLSPIAAADFPTLDDVLHRVEAFLSAGGEATEQAEVAVFNLHRLVARGDPQIPVDLVGRLAAQLEPLAAEREMDPERRAELVRRAEATRALLTQKLETWPGGVHPGIPSPPQGCADAQPLVDGPIDGSLAGGEAAWFTFTAAASGLVVWDSFGSGVDTVLTVHSACPDAAGDHRLAWSDDSRGDLSSLAAREMEVGEAALLRLADVAGAGGSFRLTVRYAGGGIAGTVRRAASGAPLAGTVVTLYNAGGFFFDRLTTGSDGRHLFAALASGDWFVGARALDRVGQAWREVDCPGFCTDGRRGDPVTVGDALVGGIDFALATEGAVAGQVSVVDGRGTLFATVVAYDESGNAAESAETDASGLYVVGGLLAGQYTLRAIAPGHVDELYDDLTCEPGCDVTAGTPVIVVEDATAEGVDFVLVSTGSIAGAVTRASNGTAINVGEVHLFDALGGLFASFALGDTGGFRFTELPAGDYFVRTEVPGFVDERYDNQRCISTCTPTAGTPVPVLPSAESTIAISLAEGGLVEGTVTAEDTGQPLAVDISYYDALGRLLARFVDAPSGHYRSPWLPSGNVFVHVRAPSGYESEAFDDLGCDPTCDVTGGTPVPVVVRATTVGVDLVLAPCPFPSHRKWSGSDIDSALTLEACRTIEIGPDVTVTASGELVLRAGESIAFRNGFRVESGGRLTAAVD